MVEGAANMTLEMDEMALDDPGSVPEIRRTGGEGTTILLEAAAATLETDAGDRVVGGEATGVEDRL